MNKYPLIEEQLAHFCVCLGQTGVNPGLSLVTFTSLDLEVTPTFVKSDSNIIQFPFEIREEIIDYM